MQVQLSKADKKALEKCIYVIHNGMISFPQGASYSIKHFEDLLKEGKKEKVMKDQILCGIYLNIPSKRKRISTRVKR